MNEVHGARRWTPGEIEAYRTELVASLDPPTPEVMAKVNRILGAIPQTSADIAVAA